MTEESKTELSITLPTITPDQYPALYVLGGLDPYYQQIRNQVLSEVPDLNTKAGIARVKSLARIVSESKTAIEKPGRNYLKQLKEMPKVIEAELRDWVTKMDALRDEVRQPVTELEEKEAARTAALDERLNKIRLLKSTVEFTTAYQSSTAINGFISELESIVIDDSWQEYKNRAAMAKEAAKVELDKALQTALTFEAQQAEIAKLKAEQEEKDRIQREKEIADQARHEAEQKALREKLESEQREQAAKDAKLKAEADAKEAQRRLEQERIDAEERQRVAVERAAEQERQRQLEEQKRIQYEAEQARIEAEIKAADIEHQREFNREVITDLLANTPELTEPQAIKLLTAIVHGKIRHVTIQY